MTYRVKILPTAIKELAALPKKIQRRFATRIDSLAKNPFPDDAKHLKRDGNTYRMRVSDYRAIYRVKKKEIVVLIIKIGHRKNVYRRF